MAEMELLSIQDAVERTRIKHSRIKEIADEHGIGHRTTDGGYRFEESDLELLEQHRQPVGNRSMKLTELQKTRICRLIDGGMLQTKVAAMFGIHVNTVSRIYSAEKQVA